MAVHDVYKVTVSIQGRTITVDKPQIRMAADDDLQWSGNEAFSIEFDDARSPFGQQLSHAQAKALNRPKVGCITGSYKYSIVCDRDRTIKLDPVVIVDPPKSGGY
jgi:hypothetical protein